MPTPRFRRPTKLERRWLLKRRIAIKINQSIDAGIIEADDNLIDLLAVVSWDMDRLRAAVDREDRLRYFDFLCGRRKTYKHLDDRYYDVEYPHAEAMPILLAGREQPHYIRVH